MQQVGLFEFGILFVWYPLIVVEKMERRRHKASVGSRAVWPVHGEGRQVHWRIRNHRLKLELFLSFSNFSDDPSFETRRLLWKTSEQ